MSVRAIIEPEGVLDVPAEVGDGDTKLVDRFDMPRAAVQFDVASGTYTLQGSVDGGVWVDLEADIVADTTFSFADSPHNHFWRYLRVVTTVAGSATATLGAYEFLGQ